MLSRVVWLCSNTYSALNALAGHYNSFGATAPIPKKRLERLTKVGPNDPVLALQQNESLAVDAERSSAHITIGTSRTDT